MKKIAMFSMQTSLYHRRYFIKELVVSQNISKSAKCYSSIHFKKTRNNNSNILSYYPTWHLKFFYKYEKFKYVCCKQTCHHFHVDRADVVGKFKIFFKVCRESINVYLLSLFEKLSKKLFWWFRGVVSWFCPLFGWKWLQFP